VVAALLQVPDINTLYPMAFQRELTSNIGRYIDRITDTKRQAGLHFCQEALQLGM
jgi:hypothetical protein